MKGIKMIFGALAAASLLFSVNAFAQEDNNRDENGKVVRGAYETNKFFDNTWIGVGAGINSLVLFQPEFQIGNIGLSTDLNFGKWWTPAVGMRFGWHGLWNNSKADLDIQDLDAGTPFGFNYFHTDLLWNISNSFFGYKESRFWNFVPYATMGVLDISSKRNIFAKDAKNNWEYAAGAGLLNVLNVTSRVNVTLDLQALVARAHAYTSEHGRFIVFPSATIGLAFNLGKTNFDRHSSIAPVPVAVPFTVEQYKDLEEKIAALEKENAALRDKAAALENQLAPYRNLVNGQTYLYENGTFTAVDLTPGAPITVYFDLGSAKVSDREKAHLEYFTSTCVNGDTKLAVNGYADKQTGSAKRNQTLSEQRAKAVVDLLKKAGASEENIECAAHGATVQPFDTAAKNRVVTIEVK